MNYYVEIDSKSYFRTGEIKVIGKPIALGELVGREFLKKAPNTGFSIHRTNKFYEFLEVIGGKKGKFIAYLLKQKDSRNQIINKTIAQMAKDCGVSLNTSRGAIKILRDAGCIKSGIATFMINPDLEHRGDRAREMYIKNLYENFISKEEGKKDEETVDNGEGM